MKICYTQRKKVRASVFIYLYYFIVFLCGATYIKFLKISAKCKTYKQQQRKKEKLNLLFIHMKMLNFFGKYYILLQENSLYITF